MAETKPGRSFSEAKPHIRTLDLIMFKGSDVVSGLISKVERVSVDCPEGGSYTHVGLAILENDLLPVEQQNGRLLVLESTMSGSLADGVLAIDGKSHLGVQFRDLGQVVEAYDVAPASRIAWLPLQEERRPKNFRKLCQVCGKYNGIFYDASVVDLAAAAVPLLRPVRDSPCLKKLRDAFCYCFCCCTKAGRQGESNWLFCSELVANIYKDLGILPADVNPEDVMPCDFLPKGAKTETLDADKKIPWLFSGVIQIHKG